MSGRGKTSGSGGAAGRRSGRIGSATMGATYCIVVDFMATMIPRGASVAVRKAGAIHHRHAAPKAGRRDHVVLEMSELPSLRQNRGSTADEFFQPAGGLLDQDRVHLDVEDAAVFVFLAQG